MNTSHLLFSNVQYYKIKTRFSTKLLLICLNAKNFRQLSYIDCVYLLCTNIKIFKKFLTLDHEI